MPMLDKIKKFLKLNNEPEIIFLHNRYKDYALYFKEHKNKYIFVGDSDFPYSKESIDTEWLKMNKHNFKYYEEFKSLPQLINKYEKNLKSVSKEKSIAKKVEQAKKQAEKEKGESKSKNMVKEIEV